MTQYNAFLIDPPWPARGGGRSKRGADRHYPVMTVDAILKTILNSGMFCPARDCHLWLWSPNNFIEKASWLIEQLGFRFVTMLTWVKPSIGLGQYFRHRTEQLLFAVRGNGLGLRKNAAGTLTTAIIADRRRDENGKVIHSGKPDEAYRLIEMASPRPRLEMFARRNRRGWHVWGNEVGKKSGK